MSKHKMSFKRIWFIFMVLLFISIFHLPFSIDELFAGDGSIIYLKKGWNFVSFSKEPQAKDIQTALKDITSNIRIIWGFDNKTKTWQKWRPRGTDNDLEIIESARGYWIYMNSDAALDMAGWNSGKISTVLYKGWNLLGWNGEDEKSIDSALSSISEKWVIIWGWDEGIWKAKHSDSNITLNVEPLNVLNKNKAYWLKIKDDFDEVPYKFYPARITVTPSSIDFGECLVNNQLTRDVSISNSGSSPFNIKSISISGDSADDFNETNNCGAVGIGGQCKITINFYPSSAGTKTAELVILTDEPGKENIKVPLTGTGKNPPPPEVVSYQPASGATGVSQTPTISVTFSSDMDSSTIDNTTFTLSANGVNIQGTVTYNVSTRTATFKPSSSLSKGTTYTVTVSDQCKNIYGVKLVKSIIWSFTTVETASGIWRGTFTSNVVKKSYKVLGVITEDGEARFLSEDAAQFNGNASLNGNKVSATLKAFAPYLFPDGTNYGTIQLTGTVKTRQSLTGTYSGVGDTGTFNLQYDSGYERSSSISLLVGNWSNTDEYGNSIYLTVNSSGSFTGNVNNVCTFSGTISIIDPSYNAYRLKNVYLNSNCGQLSGTYSGLGVLGDSQQQNDTFIIGISNSYASIVMGLKR